MDKFFLAFLCASGYDQNTKEKCQQVIKSTIIQWQLYESIRDKQQKAQKYAELRLSKPGFWIATTVISSLSTQRLYLSGHNVIGIDSVNIKLGKDSSIDLSWHF